MRKESLRFKSMALVDRDSDSGGNGRGQEDSQSSVDSFASGNESVAKRFLDGGFTKDAERKRVLEPEKTEKFVVTDPETGEEHDGPFRFLWDLLLDNGRWKLSFRVSEPVQETVQTQETWQARISLLLLKILWFMNGPFQALGHWVEDLFNLFLANDGFFKTFYRALFKRRKLVIRERGSKDYVCIFGALDSRFALYQHESSLGVEHSQDANAFMFPGRDYGARSTADVLIMASKLAYENRNYVEEVVSNIWKMNFVAFYDCWNEFQQQENTQVFLFTDKPKNARAVVVAFRGTELFNLIDWSTDVDFSWFELKGLGKVHVGFLEALGLGDRKCMETFVIMEDNASFQQETAREGSAMSGLPADVVEEPTKILAYDEVTKKVKQLMVENPEAKLFVTGHSLGGALANLYTTFLFYNNEEAVTSRLGALYTFGQPRVGGAEYCQYMISKVHESKYWRVVYGDDIVPRVPFNDGIFEFKHCGYCYYYNERYVEMTLAEAPNANYFSLNLKTIIMLRLVALYEVFMSLFSGWIYGPEFRESYSSTGVRLLGLISPGLAAHLLNNYVNAIRLGPTLLDVKQHEIEHLEDRSKSLFSFISSFMGKKKVAARKDAHQD